MQVLASNKVTQNKIFPIFSYSASQSYISIGQEAHAYAYQLGPPLIFRDNANIHFPLVNHDNKSNGFNI